MKKLTILLLMLMVVFIGCGKDEVNRDPENSCIYNDMYWGISKEDIIAEKGEPEELTGAMAEASKNDNVIFYEEQFMNDNCNTIYYFDSNEKLRKIHVAGTSLRDYENILSMFKESFGEPLSDGFGGLGHRAEWNIGNTNIEFELWEETGIYSVIYSLITEEETTTENTAEASTFDLLEPGAMEAYNKAWKEQIWDLVSQSNEIYIESVNAIEDLNANEDEMLSITKKNDSLAEKYLDDISEYDTDLIYSGYKSEYSDYKRDARNYISFVRIAIGKCYSYAQTGDEGYAELVRQSYENIMNRYAEVEKAKDNIPDEL